MSFSQFWFNSLSLRHRLLWSVLFPMVALLLINIAVVSKFDYDSATRRHDNFLLNLGNMLKEQLRFEHGKLEFALTHRLQELLLRDPGDQVYYSMSGMHHDYWLGTPDLPTPPGELSETPLYYYADYAGRPVRMMAAILPERDIPDGRVVVMVAKTLLTHHERAQEWIWRVLPAHLVLMALSAALVWWGVGRDLRPLAALHDEVISRSSLDLHPLPEQKLIAEVRPLIHGFNELMERLDKALTSQRRFMTNAAHQLRTPLSGFMTQAELILRMNDVAQIHQTVQQLHIAADQAGHMINQLLVLASSEVDECSGFTRVNLSALVRNVTEGWARGALSKDIDMGFECVGEDFFVQGNAALLTEMLNNLIDNALRYTQNGGRVTVRIFRQDKQLIMEVEDNGPGIPIAEREQVFERFYRIPRTVQEGCGLGLSIVREIAHRHQGEIYILPVAEGSGTRMSAAFPACDERV